jgi:hypothetical protein
MRDGYEIPGTGSENDIIETPPPQSCEDCTRYAFLDRPKSGRSRNVRNAEFYFESAR